MTLAEFQKHNTAHDLPYDDIGQGNGYKLSEKVWKDIPLDEIIYIPEYGYHDDGASAPRENAYTKQDFLDLCKSYLEDAKKEPTPERIDVYAQDLFASVDWQFPESLINEGFLDDF